MTKNKEGGIYDVMKREEALKNYHGIDEVVWAAELKTELLQRAKEVPEVSMKFGFPTLDQNIHYAMGGELVIISGPTKQGKTLLAQTFTRNFFAQGVGSLWFSYEVPGLQFLQQFGDKLPSFTLPKVLKESSYPWIIDRIYEAKLKYGIQAVFIDNTQNVLNLMSHQLAQLMGEFVKAVKRTAIELNIVMFLLHHFTKVRLDDNEAMDSSLMRDSSLIAQTADTVLLVRRDKDQVLHPKKSYIKVTENRRFGVMNLVVPMQKVGYYLEEASDDEREQPDYHDR